MTRWEELPIKTQHKLAALRVIYPKYKWVAADSRGGICIFEAEPELENGQYINLVGSEWTRISSDTMRSSIRVFENGEINHDMGPVYYGEL